MRNISGCLLEIRTDARLTARSQYLEGPARPTTSTWDFLGFPVSISEC